MCMYIVYVTMDAIISHLAKYHLNVIQSFCIDSGLKLLFRNNNCCSTSPPTHQT